MLVPIGGPAGSAIRVHPTARHEAFRACRVGLATFRKARGVVTTPLRKYFGPDRLHRGAVRPFLVPSQRRTPVAVALRDTFCFPAPGALLLRHTGRLSLNFFGTTGSPRALRGQLRTWPEA